jgi:hypothetical protein
MQRLEEHGYRELARVLREWAASHAPGWTDHSDADPGITILGLMAFVAEEFAALRHPIPERGRDSAARLADAALALAGKTPPAHDGGLVRNHYFAGRLLGAEDFQLEQDYVRERLRRRNRALHGAGIVEGLQVSVDPDGGGGEQIVVQPGLALDPLGEEIEVRCEASASLPATGDQLIVALSYTERLTHPAPASGEQQVQFTRVEETFALQVEATAGEHAVALARLNRTADGWKVDEAFRVRRASQRISRST